MFPFLFNPWNFTAYILHSTAYWILHRDSTHVHPSLICHQFWYQVDSLTIIDWTLLGLTTMSLFFNTVTVAISHLFCRVSNSFVKSLLLTDSELPSASFTFFKNNKKLFKNMLKRIGPRILWTHLIKGFERSFLYQLF